MDWIRTIQVISDIFGIVEAIAVVVSLLYLARELRTSTKAARSTTYQAIVNGFLELEARVSQDKNVARIYHLARERPKELSEIEKAQANEIMTSYFNLYENLFYQYRNGLLEEERWAGWCRGLMYDFANRPGVREWWKEIHINYSKDLCEYINLGKCPEA